MPKSQFLAAHSVLGPGGQTCGHESYRQHPGMYTLMFRCSMKLFIVDEPISTSVIDGLRIRQLCSNQGVFDPLQGNL